MSRSGRINSGSIDAERWAGAVTASVIREPRTSYGRLRSLLPVAGHPAEGPAPEPLSALGGRTLRGQRRRHRKCRRSAHDVHSRVSERQVLRALAETLERDCGGEDLPAERREADRLRPAVAAATARAVAAAGAGQEASLAWTGVARGDGPGPCRRADHQVGPRRQRDRLDRSENPARRCNSQRSEIGESRTA